MDAAEIAEFEARPQFKILSKLVQKEGGSSVADVIQELNDLTLKIATESISPDALGGHVYHTFLSLLELVDRTIPSEQTALIDFLIKLQQTTVSDPTSGQPLRVEGELVWTELPTFGYTATDDYKTDVWDPELTAEELQKWENKNAYYAQVWAASDATHLNSSPYAHTALVTAFEYREPLGISADAAIRTACLWFIYAADRLWGNVREGRKIERGGPGKKFEGKGWEGFELERWGVWEKGLREARERTEDEETRKLIGDALVQIERVSKE